MEKSNRFISLDAFRGLTIALMILVNTPGSWSHRHKGQEIHNQEGNQAMNHGLPAACFRRSAHGVYTPQLSHNCCKPPEHSQSGTTRTFARSTFGGKTLGQSRRTLKRMLPLVVAPDCHVRAGSCWLETSW